jgi:hypothetical protein
MAKQHSKISKVLTNIGLDANIIYSRIKSCLTFRLWNLCRNAITDDRAGINLLKNTSNPDSKTERPASANSSPRDLGKISGPLSSWVNELKAPTKPRILRDVWVGVKQIIR